MQASDHCFKLTWTKQREGKERQETGTADPGRDMHERLPRRSGRHRVTSRGGPLAPRGARRRDMSTAAGR